MHKKNNIVTPVLLTMLLITLLIAIASGAVSISLADMAGSIKHLIKGEAPANIHQGVFLQLRLPRVLLCAITGAILSVSGVLMQGLFRNPIVEPGLVGTSAGAAFGASVVYVLSANFSPELKAFAGTWLIPVFAFIGGLTATFIVYALAKNAKRVSILSLLLTGIAVNAVGLSGTGFMSYITRDPQARSITFWNLGTFTGASWIQVIITAIVATIIFIISFRYSKKLNTLLLGEEEAAYLGVDVTKLKIQVMVLNTAMVAVATAFVGVISFVGLIVPHIMRLVIGSDNKKLLPTSIISGSILLVWADMGARLLLAPAEIPVGIITSLVGAPVFIILLKRFNVAEEKGGYNA